jgi:hypothetical protein
LIGYNNLAPLNTEGTSAGDNFQRPSSVMVDFALHSAIQAVEYPEKDEDVAIVQGLVEVHDVNGLDKLGNTPIIIAAERGLPKIVACLIEHGADTNKARESDGMTPLIASIIML